MPSKKRLDVVVVEQGLCPSRTRARSLILAGRVIVDDQRVDKPGATVREGARVRLKGEDMPYVSRGGLKLAGALAEFAGAGLCLEGKVVMDVGASTGGFTDCALQAGARRVYAIDVGYGQLAWKLVEDPRVEAIDRQNIRTLEPERIGEAVEAVVADCSFISLTKVLPHLPAFLAPRADVVALVKPQFELGPGRVGKGGIVRDEVDRLEALNSVQDAASALGFSVRGNCVAAVAGRDGNREWLTWLSWSRAGEQASP